MRFLNIILVVLSLTACSFFPKEDNRSIDDLVTRFGNSGLQVTGLSPKIMPGLVGAIEVVGISINGAEVEVGRYDPKNESGKLTLAKIKNEKQLTVMGVTVPAVVNGAFVLRASNKMRRQDSTVARVGR
ncbi:MAG TPA: hypothetical protein VGK14_13090 [Novimethylophilus sp.]|jgi:hypothetical protein|uniref:hypothetical protein n=1 Tax=Novimethylophilus sp. TaxID=2137426 RepID=UPI002F4212EF